MLPELTPPLPPLLALDAGGVGATVVETLVAGTMVVGAAGPPVVLTTLTGTVVVVVVLVLGAVTRGTLDPPPPPDPPAVLLPLPPPPPLDMVVVVVEEATVTNTTPGVPTVIAVARICCRYRIEAKDGVTIPDCARCQGVGNYRL